MIGTIVTIILVSAFFILFFEGMTPENKKEKKKGADNTDANEQSSATT